MDLLLGITKHLITNFQICSQSIFYNLTLIGQVAGRRKTDSVFAPGADLPN